mgnify:CR=1 FL=1
MSKVNLFPLTELDLYEQWEYNDVDGVAEEMSRDPDYIDLKHRIERDNEADTWG